VTPRRTLCRFAFGIAASGIFAILVGTLFAQVQENSYQRAFPQSKATVEKALKVLQPTMSGRLPVLDGFATPGEHSLDRYQRGYYQATAEVTSNGSGALVRISTKVTAWYDDPAAARSGYQLLKSNGRLEADLLDQLQDQLAKSSSVNGTTTSATVPSPKPHTESKPDPAIAAPAAKFPDTDRTFSSSSKESLPSRAQDAGQAPNQPADKTTSALQSEMQSLQEIVKNIAHPKNLVAVKKSGTPVVGTPSLNAKAEFLASMHDEFELLDFNADWVHVKISGLSRGWIWRNSVEMPDGIPDTDTNAASALSPAADLFHVIREETAPFPGDWEPLRSKNVEIISVQKIDEATKSAGPKERLEYAKFLLEKSYKELAKKTQDLQGIVVIFDSADGGMIAATTATLQQWVAGKLSDSALWHQCFFDPPETFDSTGAAGSR
jgi:hypothetical protein